MLSARKQIVLAAIYSLLFVSLPVITSCALFGGGSGGGGSGVIANEGNPNAKNSELVIRRVDSNQLIRLRIYIDGKSQGILKVGESVVYKIKNGYHTVRVGFDDYNRSSEVAQFTANNSTTVFSVTDTSIVLVSEEPIISDEYGSITPIPLQQGSSIIAATANTPSSILNEASLAIDNSVRSAFDKATKGIKRGKRIVIVNVDADNIHEANFILEELTLLSVNSPKNFFVIDRRMFDAFTGKNAVGLPSYENDFMLRYVGSLVQADYVISGRVDGPGDLRRLRVKALEVASGALVGDASEKL
ncbi:MAG: hypothetical protein LBD07_02580 [Spirochaetaceae bacterium]|jgi:hypothetical protein|nr:hypothetical protein [Spirochaetaceae bacterium]